MKRSKILTHRSISALAVLVTIIFCEAATFAQTSVFTYQGRFTDTTVAQPTNGNYTMRFLLYNAETGGNQVPNTTEVVALVSVVNGIFTTKLDFGAEAFTTSGARYLEIQVGSTILTPRQEITSTPFALRSLSAANADSLGGVAANQYVRTNDARLSDARAPTAGSTNYVQNTTMPQSANFNVGGNGVIGGRVGIGTTSAPPTASLQINGGVQARGGTPGGFGANNNGYAFSGNNGDSDSGLFSETNGRVSLFTDSAERLRVNQNGDVAIGAVEPTAKLDVRGDIKLGATGNLFAASGDENLRLLRGVFEVNNGVVTVREGSGFTVGRISTGVYRVTYTTPFSDEAVIIPTVISGATISGSDGISSTEGIIKTYTENGVFGDPRFVMFIAIGPR